VLSAGARRDPVRAGDENGVFSRTGPGRAGSTTRRGAIFVGEFPRTHIFEVLASLPPAFFQQISRPGAQFHGQQSCSVDRISISPDSTTHTEDW
jgi:hypothetical protein